VGKRFKMHNFAFVVVVVVFKSNFLAAKVVAAELAKLPN
jgi:hypothetical protein